MRDKEWAWLAYAFSALKKSGSIEALLGVIVPIARCGIFRFEKKRLH